MRGVTRVPRSTTGPAHVPQRSTRREPSGKSEPSRQRILDAARREFGMHGFHGARVEAIARRANVTKGLVFYYFQSKEELFRALSEQRIANMRASDPPDSAGLTFEWALRLFEGQEESADWTRYHLWEGLRFDADLTFEIPQADLRSQNFAQRVAEVERSQLAGRLPADLDPRQLTFFLFAFAAYPYLLPQMAHLITGHRPTDDAFRREFITFLRQVSSLFEAAARP
jgi:AcrR family transcriptional regulator